MYLLTRIGWPPLRPTPDLRCASEGSREHSFGPGNRRKRLGDTRLNCTVFVRYSDSIRSEMSERYSIE